MSFILKANRIQRFDNLRKDYEATKKIKLKDSSSIFGMPTLLGGTDIKNRRKQISFLEKIKIFLNQHLLKEEDIQTLQQWQANLMASRIMIAACWYVQSEINCNALLNRLINKYLGVTAENFFDPKDKKICYQTAHKFIDQWDVLASINMIMSSLGKNGFSDTEWEKFSTFILKKDVLKETNKKNKSNNYPVTTLVQPIFEAAFSYVGSTIGWVVAEAVNSSSATIAPQIQINSLVGGALLTLGPTGAALLAPTIVARLLSSFCTTSLTSMSGKAMGLVGKGTGIIVGLPLDLIYNLISAAGSLLISHSPPPSQLSLINGIRIADGVFIINGQAMQFKWIPKKRLSAPEELLQIMENGEIYLNGKPIEASNSKMAAVIKELNQKFLLDPDAPKPEIINPKSNS